MAAAGRPLAWPHTSAPCQRLDTSARQNHRDSTACMFAVALRQENTFLHCFLFLCVSAINPVSVRMRPCFA